MNRDTRINWNMGMELLPETFIHLENQLAEYRMMLRKVQASRQFGLIPDMPFNASVTVDGGTLTLNSVECHALLQHGDIVDIKRDVSFKFTIPNRSCNLYLAVWTADKEMEYEIDDVPFIRHGSQFGFFALGELVGKMPIAKLLKNEEGWKVHDEYVVPLVTMETSRVVVEKVKALLHLAKQAGSCEQFAALPNHEIMGMLVDEMACVDTMQGPKEFAVLCRRFARLLAVSIMPEPVRFVDYNPYDVQMFLDDMLAFLTKANEVLSSIALEEVAEDEKQSDEPEVIEECPIL